MSSNTPTVTTPTDAVQMPNPNRRAGRRSAYPFDDLDEQGMSFGIVGKSAKDLQSIISNQNRKYRDVAPDGSPVQERHFFARDVDPETDPDGATVRVFRDI